MEPVKLLIIGAGNRGMGYSKFALAYPKRVRVVGVAEPRTEHRDWMVKQHNIPPDNIFTSWEEAAQRPRFSDAVIIATQDRMHRGPAEAFAELGYHMLLEKPMADNEEDCKHIIKAVMDNDIIFAVGHVLRYTRYTQMLKEIIDSGRIGEVVSIQRLEPVGYWHQAHSFVRGNWRNTDESSSMLLAKSCHDLDWIHHIMGSRCTDISSFGSLKHFRVEEKPDGAAERCMDCIIEEACPYSAKKIYLGSLQNNGNTGWPVDVLTLDTTVEGVTMALQDGPYGRCVYACDNNVVDNQVVNMAFEGGTTASFVMTAFTKAAHRLTRIFGTHGEITGDGTILKVFDFMTDETETIDTSTPDNSVLEGHGGGDHGLMDAFMNAVANNDPSSILSGPEETLESHLMVFAAEKARLENKVVKLQEVKK